MKPSIPKGTRDFSPVEMNRRNYIFDTIKGVFKKYGYQQIETPSMENLETLTGKYGDEGDKLLFRILESGDYLKGKKTPFSWNDFENVKWSDLKDVTWDNLASVTGSTTSNYSTHLLPEIVDKGL